jgi:hypothetical protein
LSKAIGHRVFVGGRLDLLAVERRERLLPSLGGHDQFVGYVGNVL